MRTDRCDTALLSRFCSEPAYCGSAEANSSRHKAFSDPAFSSQHSFSQIAHDRGAAIDSAEEIEYDGEEEGGCSRNSPKETHDNALTPQLSSRYPSTIFYNLGADNRAGRLPPSPRTPVLPGRVAMGEESPNSAEQCAG
jgi:hypothetical protein